MCCHMIYFVAGGARVFVAEIPPWMQPWDCDAETQVMLEGGSMAGGDLQ